MKEHPKSANEAARVTGIIVVTSARLAVDAVLGHHADGPIESAHRAAKILLWDQRRLK